MNPNSRPLTPPPSPPPIEDGGGPETKGPQDQVLALPELEYESGEDHLREALTVWNYDVVCPAPHEAWSFRVFWKVTVSRQGHGLLELRPGMTQVPSLRPASQADRATARPDQPKYPSLSLDDLNDLCRNHDFPQSVMKKLPSLAAQMINLHRN
jgi:hypothetical protein